MRMPSPMKGGHFFSMVPKVQIERSQFDRSHGHKTTFDSGYLVPIYVDEALPGDTFHMRASGFLRQSTLIKPLMDNFYFDTFFFFVPLRLVWTNFVKFMGEQTNPGDSTSYTVPMSYSSTGVSVGKLEDYFGIPTGVVFDGGANAPGWSALYARAYWLIYNQWFRDENLINSVTVPLTDTSGDVTTGNDLRKRGKRHDYFTSCLPWPQKGVAVSIPLGTSAPVKGGGATEGIFQFKDSITGALGSVKPTSAGASVGASLVASSGSWGANDSLYPTVQTGLYADLNGATAATINSLRQAFAIQKLLERDARGGTRYIEKIKAHFGVTSPDARLQRPEYLGGSSSLIVTTPIAQNAQTGLTGGNTPLGNLAGIGTGTFGGHGFVKSFTEHGILLGIGCVRAELTYQQGLNRMFSRSSVYDFFWPPLAHIGEQAVLNKEIYAQGTSDDNLAFGYQERYAEYRYKPSQITGKFRSTYATPLDVWHLSQKFTALPVLGQTFIEETPPTRWQAVTSEPQWIADFWFDLKCARPMPVYGVPGLIDHF